MRLVPQAGTGSAEVCGYWTIGIFYFMELRVAECTKFVRRERNTKRRRRERARDGDPIIPGGADNDMGHGMRGI